MLQQLIQKVYKKLLQSLLNYLFHSKIKVSN